MLGKFFLDCTTRIGPTLRMARMHTNVNRSLSSMFYKYTFIRAINLRFKIKKIVGFVDASSENNNKLSLEFVKGDLSGKRDRPIRHLFKKNFLFHFSPFYGIFRRGQGHKITRLRTFLKQHKHETSKVNMLERQ